MYIDKYLYVDNIDIVNDVLIFNLPLLGKRSIQIRYDINHELVGSYYDSIYDAINDCYPDLPKQMSIWIACHKYYCE